MRQVGATLRHLGSDPAWRGQARPGRRPVLAGPVLAGPGYSLTRLRPFDLFPHTPHVECVARFDRTA